MWQLVWLLLLLLLLQLLQVLLLVQANVLVLALLHSCLPRRV